MEFGGFIGGFGKIFFTKDGIKREKEGFWGRWKGEVIFFLKSFEGGGRRIRNFMGECIFGLWGGERKNRERIGFLGYVWEGM